MSDNNSEAFTFRAGKYSDSLIDLTEDRDDPCLSANFVSETYNSHQRGISTYFNELVGLRMGRQAARPVDGDEYEDEDEDEDEEDDVADQLSLGDGYASANSDDIDGKVKETKNGSDASVEDDNASEHSELPAAKAKNLLSADLVHTNRLLQDLVNSQNGMCASIADLASSVKELVLLQTMNKNIISVQIRLASVNAEAIKDAINDENNKNITKTTPSHENNSNDHAMLNKLNKTIEDMQHDQTTSVEALTLRIEELELDRAILRKRITVLEDTKKDGRGKEVSNNRMDKLEKMVKLEHKGMSHRIEVCEQQQGRSLNRLINNREGLDKVRERVGKLEEVVRKSAGSLEDGRQKGPKPGEWW